LNRAQIKTIRSAATVSSDEGYINVVGCLTVGHLHPRGTGLSRFAVHLSENIRLLYVVSRQHQPIIVCSTTAPAFRNRKRRIPATSDFRVSRIVVYLNALRHREVALADHHFRGIDKFFAALRYNGVRMQIRFCPMIAPEIGVFTPEA